MENSPKVLKLTLPIPISNNKYLYPKRIGKGVRLAETALSKRWKKKVTPIIKEAMIDQKWDTTSRGIWLDVKIDYYFLRMGQDPNNYLKVLYDVMENCGVYENDDMCKPQTGIVVIDKFNPRLEITVSIASQVGVFQDRKDRENFVEKYSDTSSNRSFDALLKKLDDNRITENVYYDSNMSLHKKQAKEDMGD